MRYHESVYAAGSPETWYTTTALDSGLLRRQQPVPESGAFRLGDVMKEITLTQGEVALVDDADYEEVMKRKWHVTRSSRGGRLRRNLYAVGYKNCKPGYMNVLMHREIMGAPQGMDVHHINGNGLDNRRRNLRVCTHQENQCGRHSTWGLSRYLGVSKSHRGCRKPWRAVITSKGKEYYLGCFYLQEQAARAYDRAALRFHGEFAALNFPDAAQLCFKMETHAP